MSNVARGFHGRASRPQTRRLPPGQHLTGDFPPDEPAVSLRHGFCDGGYTTNLPVEDLLDGKAIVVWEYEGESLAREHGGPARLLVPHLYFWKSAKWVRGCASWGTTSWGSGK